MFFLGKFLSAHHVLNWAGLSARLYAFCLVAGIVHHLVHAEKWAKGFLWEVLNSLKEGRKLMMKKTFFLKQNLFFSSKIWNYWCKKNFFSRDKTFFFFLNWNLLKKPFFWKSRVDSLQSTKCQLGNAWLIVLPDKEQKVHCNLYRKLFQRFCCENKSLLCVSHPVLNQRENFFYGFVLNLGKGCHISLNLIYLLQWAHCGVITV